MGQPNSRWTTDIFYLYIQYKGERREYKMDIRRTSAESSYNVAQEVKAAENTMIAGMSPMLSNSLQFSSNLAR